LKTRIIEIYRQCYELCSSNPEGVITDFVAAHPQLSFEANWLSVLVETQAGNRDFRPNGPRNRLFRALATGFRRAAEPEARINSSLREARLDAARCARQEIRKDLEKWDNGPTRRHGLGITPTTTSETSLGVASYWVVQCNVDVTTTNL
jgi:hypothetical protein